MTDRLHDAGSSAVARDAASRRIAVRARCAARFHAGDELQPGSARSLLRCHLQAHAARRLSLCMGRRAVRVLASRGVWPVPIRSSSGETSESARPPSVPRRRSRSRAKWRARPAAGFTSAPVFTTIRRCGRRCTINRCTSLSVSADFTLLNNQNPLAGTNYKYSSHQESLSFYWSPRGSKIFDIQGSYSRSDLKSNIGYLDPGTLSPQVSRYRDNAHTATALLDLAWPHGKRFAPKLAAGGIVLSSLPAAGPPATISRWPSSGCRWAST